MTQGFLRACPVLDTGFRLGFEKGRFFKANKSQLADVDHKVLLSKI
jgi:hypothetical protein